MQIEHKTEKGTILFVKVPECVRDFEIYTRNDGNTLFSYFLKSSCIPVELLGFNWKFIGISNEITEEQAKMMVDVLWDGFKNYELSDGNVGNYKRLVKSSALDSFKSLMQHLQVYEVNPCSHPSDIEPTNLNHYNYISEKWLGAQSRTGKWVTLFKKS